MLIDALMMSTLAVGEAAVSPMVTAPALALTVMPLPLTYRVLLAGVPDIPPSSVVAPVALKFMVAVIGEEVPRVPFRKRVEVAAAPGVVLKFRVSETVARGRVAGSVVPARSVDHLVKSLQLPDVPSQ